MAGDNNCWIRPRNVAVVVDNDSWVLPHALRLVDEVNRNGDHAYLVRRHEDIRNGQIAFYLGCMRIVPTEVLIRNHWNLVVHASDLPLGRGFSPMTWLLLEGKNDIPVCLLEAAPEVDAGPVIFRDRIKLKGNELINEIREELGACHVRLCRRFLDAAEPPQGVTQQGDPSFYPRRRPADSRLNPAESIQSQFNLLRVVDNSRYPAYFDYRGRRYKLLIESMDSEAP